MSAGAAIPGSVETHCPYCAMQCGMTLVPDEAGRFTVAPRDFPTNRGGLCRKGWTATTLLHSPDRLLTPLMRDRKGDALRPVTWDVALDRIATELLKVRAESGPDAVGVFGGGGLTNEKAYLLGKFARLALGTANIDYNGRFCMASAAAAGLRAFGIDRGLPFPMGDIAETDVLLCFGGNPAETLPPIMQYFDEQRTRGGRFIVVDPRRTATAKLATHHLQVTPGTDGALASGMLNVAIRDGLIDPDFIERRTSGFEAVRRAVQSYWPERVERITGVPEKQIVEAAHVFGEAATAIVLSGRGPEQQSQGVNNVLSFINLALACGHAGKRGSGYGCLTGQGNGQGGREHGQKADQLPGYRRIDNPQHRAEVAAVWGVDPATLPKAGLSACELLAELGQEGGIRALLVFASNIVVSAPEAAKLEERIGRLDFMATADLVLSETSALADVVLPVAQWAEEEGTMTNLEGRILHRRPATAPPPGVWTDAQVLSALADRLGHGRHFAGDLNDTFAEFRRATAGGVADYSGVTYDRIDREDGVFWPCPGEDHPGTPRMFLDRFGHEDGRAKFHAVQHRLPGEDIDAAFPFYLTTGRVLLQYQSGAQTRLVPELNDNEPDPFVEINADTAKGMGIAAGDPVRLTTRRGTLVFKARLTRDIRFDTVFVPFHWGGQNCANVLTHAVLDPVSRIPEFKLCAVHVAKAVPLSAGAAASNAALPVLHPV